MKKSEFRALCNKKGHNNPISIEEALIALLNTQPEKTIKIPVSEYCPEDADPEDKELLEINLVEFLLGCISILVKRVDQNDRESYISEIKLSEDGYIIITVYDYYEGVFREVSICDLDDSRDAMRFANEYATFDGEPTGTNAGDLTAKQLDVLDEFLAAAERLNEAGVSLIWDEDNNSLCAANRDAMRDCGFFRVEPGGRIPEDALLLSDTATNGLDIEISYMSKDNDLYYHKK